MTATGKPRELLGKWMTLLAMTMEVVGDEGRKPIVIVFALFRQLPSLVGSLASFSFVYNTRGLT